MAVKNIDSTVKWNDYVKEYNTNSLFLWNGYLLYVAHQDDVNMYESDIEDGYLDSWVIDMYSPFDDTPQGGQWLEKGRIEDIEYTLSGIMERLYECDLWEDNWIILDPKSGERLQDLIEVIERNEEKCKFIARLKLKYFLFKMRFMKK